MAVNGKIKEQFIGLRLMVVDEQGNPIPDGFKKHNINPNVFMNARELFEVCKTVNDAWNSPMGESQLYDVVRDLMPQIAKAIEAATKEDV